MKKVIIEINNGTVRILNKPKGIRLIIRDNDYHAEGIGWEQSGMTEEYPETITLKQEGAI